MGQRHQLIRLKDQEEVRDLSDASSQFFISTEEFQLDSSRLVTLSVFYDIRFNDLILKTATIDDPDASQGVSACSVSLKSLDIHTRNVDEIQEVIHQKLEASLDRILHLFPANLRAVSIPETAKVNATPKSRAGAPKRQTAVEEEGKSRDTDALRDIRLSSMALIFQIRSFTMLKKIKVASTDRDPRQASSEVCCGGEESDIEDLLRPGQQRLRDIGELLQDQLQLGAAGDFAGEQQRGHPGADPPRQVPQDVPGQEAAAVPSENNQHDSQRVLRRDRQPVPRGCFAETAEHGREFEAVLLDRLGEARGCGLEGSRSEEHASEGAADDGGRQGEVPGSRTERSRHRRETQSGSAHSPVLHNRGPVR